MSKSLHWRQWYLLVYAVLVYTTYQHLQCYSSTSLPPPPPHLNPTMGRLLHTPHFTSSPVRPVSLFDQHLWWLHVIPGYGQQDPGSVYTFLIVVDAHSKWLKVMQMKSTTYLDTIHELHRLFSFYGLPEQLISDNGLQFTSEEFQHFFKLNWVKQVTKHFREAKKYCAQWQLKGSRRLTHNLCTIFGFTQRDDCAIAIVNIIKAQVPSCSRFWVHCTTDHSFYHTDVEDNGDNQE